jgi:hypothetical protein
VSAPRAFPHTVTSGTDRLGVELAIRNGVVRLYTRVDGPTFVSNAVRLPLDDFRDLVEHLTAGLRTLEAAAERGDDAPR